MDDKEILFCSKCGRKLEIRLIREAKYLPNFDPYDGHKIVYFERRCPEYRWWNGHTLITPDGDTGYYQ